MRLISLMHAAMSLAAPTAQAQTPYTHAQTKAANLARMRAEKLNGGLRLYRADRCMSSPAVWTASSLPRERLQVERRVPGWQQQSPPDPTLETEVLISIDGDEILDVPYNGPLR